MYQHYVSRQEYEDIVNDTRFQNETTSPHCNATFFHEPNVCPFCDGYYKHHPNFRPASYVSREANGWGGNAAPIVDDVKAAAEDAAWKRAFDVH